MEKTRRLRFLQVSSRGLALTVLLYFHKFVAIAWTLFIEAESTKSEITVTTPAIDVVSLTTVEAKRGIVRRPAHARFLRVPLWFSG